MRKSDEKRLEKLVNMQKGEHCALVVRKHWFVFARRAIAVFFAGLIAWFILGLLKNLADDALSPIFAFWQAWIIFVSTLALFVEWTNYYLDMWIVTNKRILHVDQIRLFSRMIAATRIDRVQDVKAKVSGLIQTFLGFGDLHVQTAGTNTNPMLIRGIPYPNEVRRVILKYLDHSIDQHGMHNKDGIGHN